MDASEQIDDRDHDRDTPMSAAIIRNLIEANEINVADIADLLCIEKHSVYPYLAERELRYGQLRTLIRQTANPAIRQAFEANLFGGLAGPANLDLNGDGVVDRRDACTATAEAMRRCASLLEYIATSRDEDITRQDIESFFVESECLCEDLKTACAVMLRLAQQRGIRRKARAI